MKKNASHRKKLPLILILVSLPIALIAWIVWGNVTIKTTHYTVTSSEIPAGFDGYTIAQVSDLHNAEFGEENKTLVALLTEAAPDIIVLTGDLIDSTQTDVTVALAFAEQAVNIAPTYYVTGNHEARVPTMYTTLEQGLTELGVIILRDEAITLERNGDRIYLGGIDDPDFASKHGGIGQTMAPEDLKALFPEDGFSILLSHRPEYIKTYADADLDLVLCGHAHGGQFRLPFVGGLYAPHQGKFPEYDGGHYIEDTYVSEKHTVRETHMIVSRGIGNSVSIPRINNRPELVIVTLEYEN